MTNVTTEEEGREAPKRQRFWRRLAAVAAAAVAVAAAVAAAAATAAGAVATIALCTFMIFSSSLPALLAAAATVLPKGLPLMEKHAFSAVDDAASATEDIHL